MIGLEIHNSSPFLRLFAKNNVSLQNFSNLRVEIRWGYFSKRSAGVKGKVWTESQNKTQKQGRLIGSVYILIIMFK